MKTWDEFYPDVLPDIPADTPSPMVDRALLRAAQEFIRRTRCWRAKLDPTYLTAGIDTYDIELPTNATLNSIERAWVGGCEVRLQRAEDAYRCDRGVYTPDGSQIVVRPMPANVQSNAPVLLVLECILELGSNAQGVDNAVFNDYAQYIALGAVGRLAKNATGSAAWAQFESACDRIQTKVWRGRSAARPRTISQFF